MTVLRGYAGNSRFLHLSEPFSADDVLQIIHRLPHDEFLNLAQILVAQTGCERTPNTVERFCDILDSARACRDELEDE